MTNRDFVLQAHDQDLGSLTLGDLWILSRAGLLLRCAVATHPRGWELRLEGVPTFYRSRVCTSEIEVFDVADLWKAEATAKGWI
jgi:hypothetical protein